MNLVLYNSQTIRFARLGCDAVTWNVVKRLANQNRVNCLFDMIGQSNMLSFYGSGENVCLGHRGLRNEEDKTSFNLGCSAERFAVSLLSNQFAQLEGTVNSL